MIKIKDAELRKGAAEGMDGFIQVFTDAYMQAIGGEFTEESMARLNGVQHTLLAYKILRDGGWFLPADTEWLWRLHLP